ncbi:MAG TPA: hypothetical protein VIZ68_02140, partial [Thermoplasmata archaeon]
ERLADVRAELDRVDLRRQSASVDRDAAAELLQTLSNEETRHEAARRASALAAAEVDGAQREAASSATGLEALVAEGPQHEPPVPTPRSLSEIDSEIGRAQSDLDLSVADLARREQLLADTDELLRAGVCPQCHQSVDKANFKAHRDELLSACSAARTDLTGRRAAMAGRQEERRARERYERNRLRWLELERARQAARDRHARAVELLGGLTDRVGRADAELAQIEARRRDLAPRAVAARARQEEHSALEARRTELDRELRRLATAVEEDRLAERSLERLEDDLRSDEGEQSERTHALLALQTALEGIRARLGQATALDGEMSRASDQVARVREEVARAARESARAEALAETLRRQLREALVRLEERSRLLGEARGRRELATWFSQTFREAVLTLERRLLGRAQAEFERTLARYFSLLVEDAGLVARCDPAFSPSVEIDGEWTPPEALSGGERTALALAFRLALGGVVRSAGRLTLETLILDEPTDGFSPEQVVRMGELLENLGIPQVLLVSHEPQLTSVADRIVRVEKRDGRSTLSADLEIAASARPPPSPWESKPRRKARSTRLDPPTVSPT